MSGRGAVRATAAYRKAVGEIRENADQWAAYNAADHCVVLAGPGSGKTKTLTVKIARYVIEQVAPPRSVACITYNSECARELELRLDTLGVGPSSNVFVGTVHSFCFTQILLPYGRLAGVELPDNPRVALSSERTRLFAEAVANEFGGNEPPSNWRIRMEEYRRIHTGRNDAGWREDLRLASLVDEYERRLRQAGLIDFDDMVLLGLHLIRFFPWVRKALNARYPASVDTSKPAINGQSKPAIK